MTATSIALWSIAVALVAAACAFRRGRLAGLATYAVALAAWTLMTRVAATPKTHPVFYVAAFLLIVPGSLPLTHLILGGHPGVAAIGAAAMGGVAGYVATALVLVAALEAPDYLASWPFEVAAVPAFATCFYWVLPRRRKPPTTESANVPRAGPGGPA